MQVQPTVDVSAVGVLHPPPEGTYPQPGGHFTSKGPEYGAEDADRAEPVLETVRRELAARRDRGCYVRVEHFSKWVLVREFVYNYFVPFSWVLVLLAEGPDGLRRREMLLPIWLRDDERKKGLRRRQVMMGLWTLVTPACVWTTLWLCRGMWGEIARSQARVDVLYVLSIVLVHELSVARKWATWDEATMRSKTSSFWAKRGVEMIGGWLRYSDVVAARLILSATLEARLDAVGTVRVMPLPEGSEEAIRVLRRLQGAGRGEGEEGRHVGIDISTTGRVITVGGGTQTQGAWEREHVAIQVASRQGSIPQQGQQHAQQQAIQSEAWPPSVTATANPVLLDLSTHATQAVPQAQQGAAYPSEPQASGDKENEGWEEVSPCMLFAQAAVQVHMSEHATRRAWLRLAVALGGASLPSLVRLTLGVPPWGYGPRMHAIILLSAIIHFNALHAFILPFMEASLVTFRRLELLSREMVGLTTRDPQLLAFARVQRRLLPCHMPLAYNSNLMAWLRLRSAVMCFGRSFRSRIEFFLSILLARALAGLLWLLADLMVYGVGFRPVLGTMLEFDLMLILTGLVSMLAAGTTIQEYSERMVLQLKGLRLESSLPCARHRDVTDPTTLGLAIDYLETERALNALRLVGIPMTSRGLTSLLAGALPLISGLYLSYLRART